MNFRLLIVSCFITLVASLNTFGQARQVHWEQDFEDVDVFWENWHEIGDVWELGSPAIGPESAFEGNQVVGTGLSEAPSGKIDARLVRHEPFLVPSADQHPRLELRQWRDISQKNLITGIELTIGDSRYRFDWVQDLPSYETGGNLEVELINPDSVPGGKGSAKIQLATKGFLSDRSFSFRFDTSPFRSSFSTRPFDTILFNNGSRRNSVLTVITALGEVDFPIPDRSDRRTYPALFIEDPSLPWLSLRLTFSELRGLENQGTGQIQLQNSSESTHSIKLSVALREPGGEWVIVDSDNIPEEGNWQRTRYNLSAFAGKWVELSFLAQHPEAAGTSSGWFLDQVQMVTGEIAFTGNETFDQGLGEWLVENGNWAVGQSQAPNGSGSFSVATARLTAPSDTGRVARLISPPLTVSPQIENPHLALDHWFDFGEDSMGRIEVREPGLDWQPLDTEFGRFHGTSGTRTKSLVSLERFAGTSIQISFVFDFEGTAVTDEAWSIDNVSLESQQPLPITFPVTFDNADSWRVTNGLWENAGGVVGTVLTDPYFRGTTSALISPPFTVPATIPSPRLQIKQVFDLLPGDDARIQIRAAGTGWQDLGTALRGSSNGWFLWEASLGKYSLQEVEIRFLLTGRADTGSAPGWIIDSLDLVQQSSSLEFPEDFSDGASGWTTSAGGWTFTGPTEGNPGTASTFPGHPYPPGSDTRLISPPFVVPPTEQRPRLSLGHQYHFAHGDEGIVEVQLGDSDWIPMPFTSPLTYSSGGWTSWELDLSLYAGREIRIGFRLKSTNPNEARPGWTIGEIDLLTNKPNSPLSESFEDNSGWYATRGIWQIGNPGTVPPIAKEGLRVAGTTIGENYPLPADSTLVGPPMQLPPAEEEPRLTYWTWFEFAPQARGTVQIRRLGEAWSEGLTQFTGKSGTWIKSTIDLTPFAGETIEIGFRLRHNALSSEGRRAWFLDDLRVETGRINIPNPESFEKGLGNWIVDGGIWEAGEPLLASPQPRTGQAMVGTLLGQTYPPNADAKLITPPFRVPDPQFNPRLRFWHWRDLADGDRGQIELRGQKEGESNVILSSFDGSITGSWKNGFVSLLPYAGKQVQITFRLLTDARDQGQGWFLDDIRLQTSALTDTPSDRAVDEGDNVFFDLGSPPDGLRLSTTHVRSTWDSPFDSANIPAPDTPQATAQLGLFSWQTSERDGPASHVFQVNAIDPQSAWNPIDSETFTIQVRERNQAPVVDPIPNQTLIPGRPVLLTPVASDPDFPTNTLTYTLDSAPAGAQIEPETGALRWQPSPDATSDSHTFSLRVTDNGQPSLSKTVQFIAGSPQNLPIELALTRVQGGGLKLELGPTPPGTYHLETSPDLVTWTIAETFTITEEQPVPAVELPTSESQQFIRWTPEN